MKHPNTLKFLLILVLTYLSISSCNNSDIIATINYRVQGCFASGKSKITLHRQNSSTLAKYEGLNEKSINVTLNPSQIDTFNLFVRDLKNLKEDVGCTTVEYYSVYFNRETIRKTDGSCNWNGFYKLKKCLFKS